MPLETLANAGTGEIGFLAGARALYYEEQMAIIQAAIAGLLQGGEDHGE